MTSTIHKFATALCIALLISAPAGRLAAQQPPDEPRLTFKASADVVTIQASVRDGRGRILGGLTPADFEIRDNGELRQILSLRSDRQSPLSLALLVDMSGSMRSSTKIAMAQCNTRAVAVYIPVSAAVYWIDIIPLREFLRRR